MRLKPARAAQAVHKPRRDRSASCTQGKTSAFAGCHPRCTASDYCTGICKKCVHAACELAHTEREERNCHTSSGTLMQVDARRSGACFRVGADTIMPTECAAAPRRQRDGAPQLGASVKLAAVMRVDCVVAGALARDGLRPAHM